VSVPVPKGRKVKTHRLLHDFLRESGIVDTETILQHIIPLGPKDGEGLLLLDIGANKADFTIDIKKSFPKAQIIAVEPFPETCEIFQKTVNIFHWSDVRLECAVCGESNGDMTYFVAEGHNTGFRRSYVSCEKQCSNNDNCKCMSLPTVSVDNMVPNEDVFLLKTDTQGFEHTVIEGATKLLTDQRARMLVIEFSISIRAAGGSEPVDFLHTVYDFGYECAMFTVQGRLGKVDGVMKYGKWPMNDPPIRKSGWSFIDIVGYLEKPNEFGSGWTNIFCWLEEDKDILQDIFRSFKNKESSL